MGDRGNIALHDNGVTIYLYTHWGGSDIGSVLRSALIRGRGRWDDAPYLYRVIFQTLIGKDDGVTGFGLSAGICDNEHPILHVDASTQSVWRDDATDTKVSFDDYVAKVSKAEAR